jgi:hypothetical protein
MDWAISISVFMTLPGLGNTGRVANVRLFRGRLSPTTVPENSRSYIAITN